MPHSSGDASKTLQMGLKPRWQAVLSGGGLGLMAWVLAACLAPDDDAGRHVRGRDPLDSLLGYYSGSIERTTCKEPNVPLQGRCGLYETDTVPTGNLSLSRKGESLVFFLQAGTFTVLPGDTVFADSADTVGTVKCFGIPEQSLSPEGPAYVVDVPVGSKEEANEVAQSICLQNDGGLTAFTLRAKDDSLALRTPRRAFRLQRHGT